MLVVNVKGGTEAGRKTKRDTPVKPWRCEHGHTNPSYTASCLEAGCREKRP